MLTLEEYKNKIIAFRDERDWGQFHNGKDEALSLVLEAAEVLEHFQWKNGDEMREYMKTHKEEIGEELADVFYWVMILCNELGLNVLDIAERKLEKTKLKYPVEKAKGSNKKYTEL